jgi:tetratricopeptide (TPR) repeat protein
MAGILNNLGNFYSDNQKMLQAEAAFIEALQIYRQLADKNRNVFLPDVWMALNNLGVFYRTNQKMPQTEAAYLEALKICRQLADKNPDAFLSNVATTLNNLGIYYHENQKMPQAEAAYLEALNIYRQLADKNPDAFMPYVATTLNNLGNYYPANQKISQAEAAFDEALKIYRQLADKNPDTFLPYVAGTLNNLGIFYETSQKMHQAEAAYLEALKIYGQLADKNPDAFLPNLATTLNNLGAFFEAIHNYETALEHYEKAIHIREKTILNGGIHEFKDWLQVLRNIRAVKDSTMLINDYKNISYASKVLAESCDKLKEVNGKLKPSAVSEYGSLSWWALFTKDYALSEKSALRCLELDNSQEWALTNLGHSQLLHGQYVAAKATYEKLKGKKDDKGKDYKQVLLDDLNALEAEGITHKDFAQARAAIEKW